MQRNTISCAWGVGLLLALGGPAFAAESTLADAAKRQDQAAIRALLKQGVDVNAPQEDGAVALHWAAHWDNLELADALLKAGARVDVKNDYDVTPLSLASENGSAAMVQRLLQAGADANASTSTGETPLMTAIRAGSLPVVQALLARGADVNVKGAGRDQTPLMWAVARQQHAIVKALLDRGADIRARSRVRPEYVSFARGDPQGGRLTGRADGTFTSDGTRPGIGWVQKGGLTPFLFAAERGDLESVKLLLSAGADVNDITESGVSALMLAAHNDYGEVAIYLLDHGADPNATRAGYSALHLAVTRQDFDLVKSLLAHKADPNVRLTKGTPKSDDPSGKFSLLPEFLVGATPFLLAAALNETDVMRVLVPAGADPRIPMQDGTTALIAALGIDPGVLGLNAFRKVPRRGAAGGGAEADADAGGGGGGGYNRKGGKQDQGAILETVKLTVELGVDVNAARIGGVVYHGANPRTKFGRDDGDTALHTATVDKLSSVVEYLVSHGARLDIKNKRGLTPLGLAASNLRQYQNGYDGAKVGDAAMAAQLKSLGALD